MTAVDWIALAPLAWFLLAVPLALLVGASIRMADEHADARAAEVDDDTNLIVLPGAWTR